MTPPTTSKTETHFKVRVPVERTLRLRNVERNMTLVEDVKTKKGQLLFPEGTTLSVDRINKLRKFSIHTVRVQDFEEKWVDESSYQNLPPGTDVLAQKEIQPPPHPDADDEAQTEGNPGTTSSAFGFLESTESPKRIADFVERLAKNLGEENQEELLESVEEFGARTENVEDLFRYLLRQIGNMEDSGKRKALLGELYELGQSRAELSGDETEDDLPGDLVPDLDRFGDEKQRLRTDILDFLHGNPEALSGVSHEDVPAAKLRKDDVPTAGAPGLSDLDEATLRDLIPELIDWVRRQNSDEADKDSPTYEDILKGSGADTLGQLIEEHDELNPTTINAFLEYLTDEDFPDPSESLRDTIQQLREGRWDESITNFDRFLTESEFRDPDSTFSKFGEQARSLRHEQDSLKQAMNREAGEEEAVEEIIDEHLEFNGRDYSKILRESELSDETVEDTQDFRGRRRAVVLEFWEHLRDHLPSLLERLDEDERKRFLESVRETTERIAKFGNDQVTASTSTGDALEADGARPSVQELLAAAREQENYELTKQTSRLPDQVIERFREHYRAPTDPDKWQAKLLETFREIVEELVLVLRVPQETVEDFRNDVKDIQSKQKEPFSLFLQPPSPNQYHLVHAYNTALLSCMIAGERELSLLESQKLLLAGALADVGLTLVPDSLYLKEGELTIRAANEISKHPIYSRKIAKYIFGKGHTVPNLLYQHHERRDGSGYPQGLAGEELHPLSQILTVSDAYTARIENRPYRSPQYPDRALRELEGNEDQYDQRTLRDVRSLLGYYPNGSVVRLTSKQLAFVKEQNAGSPENPSLYVLTDENREKLDSPKRVDLSEHEKLNVEAVLRT